MARFPNQITAWSFSRYLDYKTCPLKAKLKYIDRIPEPKNEAMDRGIEIHNKAEQYIKGGIGRIPKELTSFKTEFQMLRKKYKQVTSGMIVEDSWAFRKDWSKTRWNDWAGCWLRVKLDCMHYSDMSKETAIVTDWKTGKYSPQYNLEDYVEQLELYATAALTQLPWVETVLPRLAYVDYGITYPEDSGLVFKQSDLPELRKTWEARVEPMMKDRAFPPRPNSKCKWCHYRNDNKANGGGQCKY